MSKTWKIIIQLVLTMAAAIFGNWIVADEVIEKLRNKG